MNNYIFKITEPSDILRGENRFLFMFSDIKTDYQNDNLNYKMIDTVINYGYLVIKQMENSIFKRIYERKAGGIKVLINELIRLKEEK